MKFNSTSKNPNANLESKKVKYNQTTGLFTNPDRTIAFQSYEDANRYNMSLGGTPGDTPFQDTLKNIRKPLKDGSKGVQYKDSIQRAEEMRKERLNKAWEPVAQKMYQAAQQQDANSNANTGAEQPEDSAPKSNEEEVEDADFEVVEEEIEPPAIVPVATKLPSIDIVAVTHALPL